MATIETYKYARLRSDTNIRLARILPAESDHARIQVEIQEHDQDSANNNYIALSYACGDTSLAFQVPIFCGQRSILIYPTLYYALLKLRDLPKLPPVWCDGLCIDQGQSDLSLEERSLQVSMMNKIYPGAQQVMIDLGETLGVHHEEFISMLHEIVSIPNHIYYSIVPETFYLVSFEAIPSEELEDADQTNQTFGPDPLLDVVPTGMQQKWCWEVFNDLLSRPFFRRLWVIQEHALAREVVFLLSDTMISGQMFIAATSRLHSLRVKIVKRLLETAFPREMLGKWSSFDFADIIFRTRHWREEANSNVSWDRLYSFMNETQPFECSDMRDKVYAILGLCNIKERQHPALRVDYNEETAHLAQRVTRYLLSLNAFFVLYRSIGCGDVSDISGPSWAIDLRARSSDLFQSFINADGTYDGNLFNAGRAIERAISQNAPANIPVSSPMLTMEAIVLSSLRSASPSSTLDPEDSSGLTLAFRSWVRLLSVWAADRFPSTVPHFESTSALLPTITVDTIFLNSWTHTRAWSRGSLHTDTNWLAGIYSSFSALLRAEDGSEVLVDEELATVTMESTPLLQALMLSAGRRVACSERTKHIDQPLISLVPGKAKIGDVLAVFVGMSVPFLLRAVKSSDGEQDNWTFRIVGQAYIHGLMDGQVFEEGWPQQRETTLI